jgi:plastocyanin
VPARCLDRFGNILAQSITTAKGPDVGAGGAGTWSTELTVNVPPGSPGQLVAIGGANAQDIVAVGFGGAPPPATNPELSILNPPAFAALPQRFIVNGTAQGIGWNDIVVQAVDNQGRVLTEVRTWLQGQDVGAGGPGTWSVPLDVYAAPGTPGKIRVFVAGTNLNLSRDVTFSGQGAGSDPSQSSSNITRFTVDRQQISPGECVTFYWNTRNTQSVYFYREGEQWQSAQVDPNPDHFSACPKSTSTHYLRVTGNDGLTEIRTMPIWVGEQQRGGPGPVIPTLSANPASVSANSRCTTLTWTTSGSDVSRVTLFRNGQVVSGAGAAPSYQDCVPDAALGRDITYELRVDSQNSGWTTRQVKVTSAKG